MRGSKLSNEQIRQIDRDMRAGEKAIYTAMRLGLGASTVKRYRGKLRRSKRSIVGSVQSL